MKKLYLSKDKKLIGLCGGVAEYLGIDPTIIRILVVCISLFFAVIPALIVYLILGLVFPSTPDDYVSPVITKKLYKSSDDKKLSGVCGGIAEYFGIDSTIIRLIFALCVLFVGYGLMTYIVCLVMMPKREAMAYNSNVG